jgi:hypothetical protein
MEYFAKQRNMDLQLDLEEPSSIDVVVKMAEIEN